MRILHYFLGFPPYRTGGLTKYVMDLMCEQVKDKHNVLALWPGQMGFIVTKVKIYKKDAVDGIENYELINPLPIPLDEGIQKFDAYMKACDGKVYRDFLLRTHPNVIHIHTLMGLHKEFIEVAAALGIRTVFTTHDYFGICPKVTLYRNGLACDDKNCENCAQCNREALSLEKIKVMQSPIYRSLKNSAIVKKFRKQHRFAFFADESMVEASDENSQLLSEKYIELRTYYIEMLKKVNMIHFNSTISETVYKKYFIPKNSKVISITHQNIKDNRRFNIWRYEKKLKITCLAPAKPFKGFNVLKAALDDLWEEGYHDFILKIFSPVSNPSPYMEVIQDGFIYSDLCHIMAKSDVLVAPSIWYETFGFTILEAISYGVPVIISDHVGAKDIIGNGGIIVQSGNKEQLKQAILSLTRERQSELRKTIMESIKIKDWKTFLDETYQLYDGIQSL